MKTRLHKYLAASGVWSRREAERHILAGDVKLNGVVVSDLGIIIDDERDTVEWHIQSKWHTAKPVEQFVVYALNKPAGVTSTVKDRFANKTVLDLIPHNIRLVPVGRLDKESTGLLLLTNDGNLIQQLTHPSHHIPKTYRISCQIPPNYDRTKLSANLDKIRHGIILDGVLTAPAQIKIADKKAADIIVLEMTINEGRKRQIRRVMQKIGLNVVQLTRISIGKLILTQLQLEPGQYCQLNQHQIGQLKHV